MQMLVNNKFYTFTDFTYEFHPFTNSIEVKTNKNIFNFYGHAEDIDILYNELAYATANSEIKFSNCLRCFIQGNYND